MSNSSGIQCFVFDFDGVLFDTEKECLQLAFHASKSYEFAKSWTNLNEPPAEVAFAFLKSRYFVGPPWQYPVLLESIANDNVPATWEDFLELAQKKEALYCDFRQHYYACRTSMGKDLYKFIKPVEKSPQVFLQLKKNHPTFILSTRNLESISALWKHFFNMSLEEIILPLPKGEEKVSVLKNLAVAKAWKPGEIFFIDDYFPHLIPAHQQGFNAFLAKWGYLGPNDANSALKMGLPCVDLHQLEPLLEELVS